VIGERRARKVIRVIGENPVRVSEIILVGSV
jgi:hypothetical protein